MRRRALLAGLGTPATGSVAGCLGSVFATTVSDSDYCGDFRHGIENEAAFALTERFSRRAAVKTRNNHYESFENSYDVSDETVLTVANPNGNVTVEVTDVDGYVDCDTSKGTSACAGPPASTAREPRMAPSTSNCWPCVRT